MPRISEGFVTSALLAAWLVFGAPSEGSILQELEDIDQALAVAEKSLRTSEQQRAQAEEDLASAESALATARVHKNQIWAQYKRRVRALARQPAGSRWALLGGSESLTDFLVTSRMLRWVARHDRQVHARFQNESTRLSNLEAAFQQRRTSLDAAVTQSRGQRDALAEQRRARADLLRSVREQKDRALALAQEKRQAQERLRALVRDMPETGAPRTASLSRPAQPPLRSRGNNAVRTRPLESGRTFVQARGQLPWPAQGPLRVAYGQRVELAFGTITSHNGWDIGAPSGTRVQAIAPGRVVYAGWLRGYGQMVIVDHGENFHAVAAHLGGIDVAVGDTVQSGQTLGSVGDTGSTRGTVLYFEIRHGGVPVDPRDWLRR